MGDMIHVSSAPWWFKHASGTRLKFNTFKYIFDDCEKIITKEQQYKEKKRIHFILLLIFLNIMFCGFKKALVLVLS